MEVIYLDTNIYLDYLLGRTGKTGRDLAKCASNVITKIMKGELRVVVSDWNLKQLRNYVEGSQSRMLFELIGKNMIKIETEQKDIEEADKLAPHNFDDALHAVLAKRGGATLVVTRDVGHFRHFSSFIEARLPEEV